MRHVAICTSSTAAMASGNQPPCGIFGTFAARNPASTAISGTITIAVFARDQFQFRRAITEIRIVVISMTLVTAMPYAPARSLDVRKARTRPTLPTINAQLTSGT